MGLQCHNLHQYTQNPPKLLFFLDTFDLPDHYGGDQKLCKLYLNNFCDPKDSKKGICGVTISIKPNQHGWALSAHCAVLALSTRCSICDQRGLFNWFLCLFSILCYIFLILLQYPIASIIDGFRCSRCPNDRIDQPNMTGYSKMVLLPSWWQKMDLKDLSISEPFEEQLS